MKDTILVPVVYLLVLILLSVVLCFGSALYTALSAYNPALGLSWKGMFQSLPGLFSMILPVVVSFSVLAVSLHIDRHHRLRFLSQTVLTIVGFLSLLLLSGFLQSSAFSVSGPDPTAPVIVTNQITTFDGAVVYIESYQEPVIRGMYIKHYLDEDGTFTYHPEARLDGKTIRNPGGTGLVSFSTPNPVFAGIFTPPKPVAGFLSDIGLVANRFSRVSSEKSPSRFLVFGACIIFCLGIRIAAGITGWPLINICLAFGMYRGFFYIYRVTMNEEVVAFLQVSLSENMTQILPEMILLTAGGVLLLLRLVKKSTRSRKHEA